MKTVRLLEYLLTRYPQFSKKEIHARILCGEISINKEIIRDPKFLIRHEELDIELKPRIFASRAAGKLQDALDMWAVKVDGKIMLDAGASTGGFTSVLLAYGACKVYAVDVGYNQLAYSLRNDSRVVSMEKTNIMQINDLDPVPDAAVADLSFRSICGAASKIIGLTKESWMIALIKPQFEMGSSDPDFNGVIKDPVQVLHILERTIGAMKTDGLCPVRLTPSVVKGAKGNQEFLVLIDQNGFFFKEPDADMVLKAWKTAFPENS